MSVDQSGNLTHGVTLYDVLRNLVRGRWPNTEFNQRSALLAIDGHEQGFPDSSAWEAELQRRAEVVAPTTAMSEGETDAEKIARLEADNIRLQALQRASAGPAPVSPQPEAERAPEPASGA